jgi:hypothetical protein
MSQNDERETCDEILQETRRIKEALAASAGFDIDRILEEARRNQEGCGRDVLSPPTHQRG